MSSKTHLINPGKFMFDIVFEIIRAVVIAVAILVLFKTKSKTIREIKGWKTINIGFLLLFFGSLIDITDNFKNLNSFIFIGDTDFQSFLEKVVGYLFGFLFLAYGVSKWLPRISDYQEMMQKKLHETSTDLEKSKEEIKELSALLPICTECKKIRDDKGYWSKLEDYMEKYSNTQFSHGLCDECGEKLYGDQEWYKKYSKNKKNIN